MANGRGQFATRLGFILTAAGSAVGLGNIWKFPYLAGANGGAVFLFVYLLIVFSVGLSVMLAEFAIGRTGEKNPVGAFRHLRGGAWTGVGYMGVFAGFVILSFYSVVGGWTIAYALKTATGLLDLGGAEVLGGAFGAFVSDPIGPVGYHALFMALCVVIVSHGIDAGIERACRVLMPLLIVLLVILCARSLTLPGAAKGVAFFLNPDFSKVSGGMIVAALGQAFFSLSLGMGALITYGSYLSKRTSLPGAALWVTSLDTAIAVLAGFLVLPAVFAFGFDPGAGPGLTFITLPAVFAAMPWGALFGTLFFVLLAVAALTSAMSLMEVVVAYLVDERGADRRRAAIGAGVAIFLLGVPASLSLGVLGDFTIAGKGIFDAMDYLASNVLLPAGGIFIALFVGWVVYPKVMDGEQGGIGHGFRWSTVWRFVCRYVAPLAIAVVLVSGTLGTDEALLQLEKFWIRSCNAIANIMPAFEIAFLCIVGYAVSLVGGHITVRAFMWLLSNRTRKPSSDSTATSESERADGWLTIFGFGHISPFLSKDGRIDSDAPSWQGAVPQWLAGAVERVFFATVVGFGGVGVGAGTMVAWLGVKIAINWKRRESKDIDVIIRASQISIFANLISLLFAMIGGLIIAAVVNPSSPV